MSGKGMAPTKGYNHSAYHANYDRIFRKETMITTAHPFTQTNPVRINPQPPAGYRILEYPSGNLLSVDIEDQEVLMDRDQAVALLAILTVAVPAMEGGAK
jgi:hypothetical protein